MKKLGKDEKKDHPEIKEIKNICDISSDKAVKKSDNSVCDILKKNNNKKSPLS